MAQSKMQQLEEDWGLPIELILAESFEVHGSQTAVAEALGVSQSTISTWMAKKRLTIKPVLVVNEHPNPTGE